METLTNIQLKQIKSEYNQRIIDSINMCLTESSLLDINKAKNAVCMLWFNVFLPRYSHLDESFIDDIRNMFDSILNAMDLCQKLGRKNHPSLSLKTNNL